MMAAAVARHAGARTVVLTDINDFRLELAQKVAPGVRTVNTTKEDLHDVMHELGLKVGFDVALEMSGSPIAFKQCVDTLKEELGIDVTEACLAPFAFASHGYEAFHLLMPLFLCRRWHGQVTALEGQALAWVRPQRLADYAMPPADVPLVALLRDFL